MVLCKTVQTGITKSVTEIKDHANNFPNAPQTCGQRYHCDLQKNETILILVSFKRYFSHPEKSMLNFDCWKYY